jgi:hypothetical protein
MAQVRAERELCGRKVQQKRGPKPIFTKLVLAGELRLGAGGIGECYRGRLERRADSNTAARRFAN